MLLDLVSVPFYYLNYVGYTDRHIHTEKLFKDININVIRIVNDDESSLRQTRIAIGVIKLLTEAISKNVFPFISMDDDLKIIDSLPKNIDIPDLADFICLGGSLYECGGIKPGMTISDYDDNFYRIFYMLSLHCMIIPNINSANIFLEAAKSCVDSNQFIDLELTMKSKDLIFLSPKNGPYFYQDNYNASMTKFLWNDVKHHYLS
jgi:hypothetical protein